MKILDSKTIKKIQRILAREPNVLAAYLFGSRAGGFAGKKSDLDIGIVVFDPTRVDYGKLYLNLSQAILAKEVDLRIVTLEDTSPLFLYNLIKENICLYAQSEQARIRFEAQVLRKFYDTSHLRNIYHYYLGKAIKEGTYGHR